MTTPRYDMLEVLIDPTPARNLAATLACLQEALEPRFELEPLELRHGAPERSRQVVRIASLQGEAFTSAAAFDAELRELVGESWAWSRIGAIRAGQAGPVRS